MLAARCPAHGKCLVGIVQVSKSRLGVILGDPATFVTMPCSSWADFFAAVHAAQGM
jgi:hypothetical protein